MKKIALLSTLMLSVALTSPMQAVKRKFDEKETGQSKEQKIAPFAKLKTEDDSYFLEFFKYLPQKDRLNLRSVNKFFNSTALPYITDIVLSTCVTDDLLPDVIKAFPYIETLDVSHNVKCGTDAYLAIKEPAEDNDGQVPEETEVFLKKSLAAGAFGVTLKGLEILLGNQERLRVYAEGLQLTPEFSKKFGKNILGLMLGLDFRFQTVIDDNDSLWGQGHLPRSKMKCDTLWCLLNKQAHKGVASETVQPVIL